MKKLIFMTILLLLFSSNIYSQDSNTIPIKAIRVQQPIVENPDEIFYRNGEFFINPLNGDIRIWAAGLLYLYLENLNEIETINDGNLTGEIRRYKDKSTGKKMKLILRDDIKSPIIQSEDYILTIHFNQNEKNSIEIRKYY